MDLPYSSSLEFRFAQAQGWKDIQVSIDHDRVVLSGYPPKGRKPEVVPSWSTEPLALFNLAIDWGLTISWRETGKSVVATIEVASSEAFASSLDQLTQYESAGIGVLEKVLQYVEMGVTRGQRKSELDAFYNSANRFLSLRP